MAQHASDPPVNQPATLVWVTFFWAAVILALAAGFGLGGALLRCPPLGCPIGTWWVAAARVHGHVQLVGWAGLMVLGVGFHFLPRLRGRPLAHPVHARTALGCLLAGLLLRALTDPMLALNARAPLAFLLRAGLALSGLLELVGVTVAIGSWCSRSRVTLRLGVARGRFG